MLRDLNLAVFARDLHCRLALVSQHRGPGCAYEAVLDAPQTCVAKTTNIPIRTSKKDSNPATTLQQQISAQNEIAADILCKESVQNLRSLSLQMYEVRSLELTSAIARNLPKLKHLELRFCHQFVHDQTLPGNYWREAPEGNPCWNALVGLGSENQKALRLRELQTLRIERAGLTSTQLQKLVEANPQLRELHLANVTGVDLEFVNWLAAYCESGKSKLEKLELESCPRLNMQQLEDFVWLSGITESESSVRNLSLWMCRNVRNEMLIDLIENGEDEGFELDTLETIIPPRGPVRRFGVVETKVSNPVTVVLTTGTVKIENELTGWDKIDVDPEYVARPRAVAV